MSDALATQLGFKEYVHGTTYNGGNAPTITLASGGGSLGTVHAAKFYPYQKQDGGWRLRFNVSCGLSSTSRSSVGLDVAGILAKNTANFYQAISATILTGTVAIQRAYIEANTNDLVCSFGSATSDFVIFSGDVELASKPTWAF
jgi:stage V sporulation protein SpoVS